MTSKFIRLLALFAIAASMLGLAVTAQAAPKKKPHVTITGGSAAVTATTTTAKFLVAHGVTVSAIAPATLSGGTVTLPVARGVAFGSKLTGIITMRGGVKFATSSKSVALRRLTAIRTNGVTRLAGRVNKRFMVLARLSKLTLQVSGKTATVTGEIHLTAAAAKAIDHLLGVQSVKAGYDLGSFVATLTLK